MEVTNLLTFTDRQHLREWFEQNHLSEKCCWVACNRSKTPKPDTLSYIEIVEEALCFGWIDSTNKRLLDGRLAQRLSPRRKGSHWTELNRRRCRDLETRGLMTEAGRAAWFNGIINPALCKYVEKNIIPRYDSFDKAHRRDHVMMVICQSLELAERLGVNTNMAYAIAAYHDTGLVEGREHHQEVSARIIRADSTLQQWFTEEQIAVMADAAEDHRASSGHEPRTIYGRIVAEADRFIDADTIIRRTIQYGHDHYPSFCREEHYQRMVSHLHEKYGRNGYLHLWFEDSPNALRLKQLQDIIDDEAELQKYFNKHFRLQD